MNIPLKGGFFALIDDSDAERAARFKWYSVLSPCGTRRYVQARSGEARISLHRFLLDAPSGLLVDHINGDGLDNRRINLRLCLPYENSHNRLTGAVGESGLIGVQQYGNEIKYRAMLRYNNHRLHLGVFACKNEAARVRDYVARRLLGPYAALNFKDAADSPALPKAALKVMQKFCG